MTNEHASDGRNSAGQPASQPEPINLTEAADGIPWSAVDRALSLSIRFDACILEIRGPVQAEDEALNDGRANTIYVLVSGYGVVHTEAKTFECTKDDVILIPRGCRHRFERLDGEILFWKISFSDGGT